MYLAGTVVPRPALLERLEGPARVTVVSAPAGSGKTVLLQSWLAQAGKDGCAAWVPVGRGERDPERFWVSVAGALRQTSGCAGLVQSVTEAPDLDAWQLVERLLADLALLDHPLWLVIDDVHELGPEALRQLELLVMRAPPNLRFVLATRHDVRLGLHRLRLEGELAEIRAADLKFTLAEAGQLLAGAGVELPGAVLAALHDRTEGWAAGLRMAALALAGHPDPVRFAAEFTGTERTVAEYLLAEVLDRQPEQVRRLLLRTSVLENVNGELARQLTGDDGAEGILHDLEQAGSLVVALDAARTWFRYHQMFADLLQLELRRTAPAEIIGLHQAASGWLAEHGLPVEAVRHAQAAGDWDIAARLLADHWPGLYLDGQVGAVHELLAGFPAGLASDDGALAVVTAADELRQGSLEAAERYLDLAGRRSQGVPEARRGQTELLLGVVRLLLARQRGDLSGVVEDARRLPVLADAADAAQPGLSEDLRALALISVGSTLYWTAKREEAGEHLERGIALARRIGRPYLEFIGLAYQAAAILFHSYVRAADRGRRAVELARRHGWTGDPAFGVACGALGTLLAGQGRPDEAEPWIEQAERILTAEAQPAQFLAISYDRGVLEQARGRDAAALAAFATVEPLAQRLASSHLIIPRARAQMVNSLVRLGQNERAAQILAGLDGPEREHGEIRIATATLRLAQRDPRAALTELAPILDGSAPVNLGFWLVMAYILEAAAQDALSDGAAADVALERALDLAEPDGALTPFLLAPLDLLDRHTRHGTAHASLLAGIRGMLTGATQRPPSDRPPLLSAPLSCSELRVLRYLPTNLTIPEIARELCVSPNTVRTHIKNLYAKLDTHRRAEAVERGRALGLLAPSRTSRGTA